MTPDEFLSEQRITLRAGQAIVAPGPGVTAQILAAIAQQNEALQLAGLEAELDPYLLDPAKVECFLAGLARLAPATAAALQGRTLYLNAAGLRLGTATDLTPETLARGFELEVPMQPPGATVQPVLKAPMDAARARELSARAQQAVASFSTEVERLEAQLEGTGEEDPGYPPLLHALSAAKFRRHAAVIVWHDNVARLAAADPQDEELAAQASAAAQALSTCWMPPRTGMS